VKTPGKLINEPLAPIRIKVKDSGIHLLNPVLVLTLLIGHSV
jgi:hypothetical protein